MINLFTKSKIYILNINLLEVALNLIKLPYSFIFWRYIRIGGFLNVEFGGLNFGGFFIVKA